MSTWFAIDVTISAQAAEAVEYAFNSQDCLGTEINNLNKKQPDMRVTGYFDHRPDSVIFGSALADALRIYGISSGAIIDMCTREVPGTDWLAEWKKYWRPAQIGKFLVAPPWVDVQSGEKIIIRIEPGMAFGTGTHETTRLCLEAISEHLRDGMSFLDVGTGTGILAIAAAKLSPRSRITACDVDKDSVAIAKANAAANSVGDGIEFVEGSITDHTARRDFVCANLTLDVITPLLPVLVKTAGQVLLLSGILVEQEAAIREELSKSEISDLKLDYAGEWLSVLIRK